jgi:hypothetical protein
MGICHKADCLNPIFSNKFCINHQYLRTDSKYIDKQKDKRLRQYYPVKKIGKNASFGYSSEKPMFDDIWDTRSHVCQFTNESLEQFYGTDLWYNCFAHVLPKGKFILFKYNPENIRLVYPEFHSIVDQGTKTDRLKHPEWDWTFWDELVQQMKAEYIKFMKGNK